MVISSHLVSILIIMQKFKINKQLKNPRKVSQSFHFYGLIILVKNKPLLQRNGMPAIPKRKLSLVNNLDSRTGILSSLKVSTRFSRIYVNICET